MLPISRRFEEAVSLALELHRDQRRKGSNIPYIAHLFSVAALTMEHGGGEDEAIAALLHDAVEDRGGPPVLARIRERFGEGVGGIVASCTDGYAGPDGEKPPWDDRKQRFLEHLRSGASGSARLVIGCDKLHNARCLLADLAAEGEGVFERFKGRKAGTLWYYRAVADELKRAGPGLIARELDRVVTEIERHRGAGAGTRAGGGDG